jgi:hypothetical protein
VKAVRSILVSLLAAGAFGASAAHAQSYPSLFSKQARAEQSRVIIDQKGRENGAAVGQKGKLNAAEIFQRGGFNTGMISQTGAGNTGTIKQIGVNNDASITQTGNNNSACVVQVGRNLSTDVIQTGGQSVGVIQTNRNVREFPAELCTLGTIGNRYLQRQLTGS